MGEAAEASHSQSNRADIGRGVISAVIVTAVLLLTLQLTAQVIANYLPDSAEQKIGTWVDDFSEATPPDRAQDIFNKVLKVACQQTTCRDLDYRLGYMYDATPNAFAVIGGEIVLTNELYEWLETEEGLAFVLAHEIAHHNQRHIVEGLARQFLWQLLLSIVGLGDVPTSAVFFAEMAQSRRAEEEADRLAVKIVYELYGDKREDYAELFIRLKNNPDYQEHQRFSWVSSHPEMDERIAAIDREVDRLQQDKPATAN